MTKEWLDSWPTLEANINVGIEFCINPTLFQAIVDSFSHKDGTLYDFGAGTNKLAYQLMHGNQTDTPALRYISGIEQFRERHPLIIGLESSKKLIQRASLEKHISSNTLLKHAKIGAHSILPTNKNTLALATSRNFLMHLSNEALRQHLKEVSRTLIPGSHYVLSILNPEYEKEKTLRLTNQRLRNGCSYSYPHGATGEYGMITQYFRTLDTYMQYFTNHFMVIDCKACLPATEEFKQSHSRYYNISMPMAFVFKLQKCE